MKKILCCLILTAMSVSMITGCNKIGADEKKKAEASQSENSDESSEQSESKPKIDISGIDTDTEHIFDYTDSVSSENMKKLNDYAEGISKAYKIKTAVAVTDNLQGKEPKAFAEELYAELYENEPGTLYLINNETGEDVVYRKGSPLVNFSDKEIEMLFSKTSPMLVTGKIYDAAELFLEEADSQMPEFIIDRAEYLNESDTSDIDSTMRSSFEGKNICIVLMKNLENKTEDNFANFFKNIYSVDSDSVMLFIDPYTGVNHLEISGSYKQNLSSKINSFSDEISSFYKESDNSEDDSSSYDIDSAVTSFINLLS